MASLKFHNYSRISSFREETFEFSVRCIFLRVCEKTPAVYYRIGAFFRGKAIEKRIFLSGKAFFKGVPDSENEIS